VYGFPHQYRAPAGNRSSVARETAWNHAWWLVLPLWLLCHALSAAPANGQPHEHPLNLSVSRMQERSGPMTLQQALSAVQRGAFRPVRGMTPAFGIGERPVWIHLALQNPSATSLERRLTIDVSWLDHVQIDLIRDGQVLEHERLGDTLPQDRRPIPGRAFAVDLRIPPGRSAIMIRVATPDPMVIPVALRTPARADTIANRDNITYGFFYGFLFALLAYNLMLWLGLRASPYGLYALYLATFITLNLAYTGYGFEWLWPDLPRWQQWAPPTLMVLCACTGLLFAQSFLETRRHFPRLHLGVNVLIVANLVALVVTMGSGWQGMALWLAFTFILAFTVIMLGLGIVSLRMGIRTSRYFLIAAACSMAGDATTALAVWGTIPYTVWTFRAAEIGMLLEATLLALALTYRFRRGEARRVQAEQMARLDELTGLNNRRAFQDISDAIWGSALREDRSLSVILLDIDHFKRVNDTYGHSAGDRVLQALAQVLRDKLRDADVIARWGGEEFIVLLPDTTLDEAAAMAERLREAVAARNIDIPPHGARITASFGVTERRPGLKKLETLISEADRLMYRAKHQGRNRVCRMDQVAIAEGPASMLDPGPLPSDLSGL
jgi:two-component system, sensor histidine kinase LadS